jgi:phage shock protein E
MSIQHDTASALASKIRQHIRELSPDELREARRSGALLVDVREREEFAAGHIRGAINVPLAELESGRGALPDDPSVPIVCYCNGGNRGALATDLLGKLGFHRAASLAGGLRAFRSALGDED